MEDSDWVKKLTLLCVLVCIVGTSGAQTATPPASQTQVIDSQETLLRNSRPAGPAASQYDAKVQALLARMTLKEKVGQMTQFDLRMIVGGKGPNPTIDSDKLHKAVAEYGVGSIINVWEETIAPEKWHEIIRAIQAEAAKTRLKIPVLYGIDSIHGPNYVTGATLFPQPLGMAATWNPDLMLRASQISAAETRASGIPWNFSPILDVGRQPLWPRLYETFGEDPYLSSVMGVASVRGYEGDNIADQKHVAACAKHYVGYSFPLSGQDRTRALIPDSMLRQDFLPSFAAAIRAGLHSIMVNSADVNGTPGHVNHHLLTDVLRQELGFTGVVDSDWEDIKKLVNVHHIAATEKDATRMAIMAGVDMSMVPSDYSFSDLLTELVTAGQIPMRRIDEAVARILILKYEMGLFDDPLRGMASRTAIGSTDSNRVSLEAARESIILLKNEKRLLPLTKSTKVLVTGPTADSLVSLNNGWSYTWQGGRADLFPKDKLTVLGAIKSALPAANVTYAQGTDYDKELNIADAVSAAKTADIAIVCLGEMAYAETPGNIDDLALPDAQINLAQQIAATGKPVVLVLVEGRPRIISRIADVAQAILLGLNPGNEGGQAIADVLFGDVNPGGKLPISYPRYPNALLTYDHQPYQDQDTTWGMKSFKAQFPFGFGLSYAAFEYSDLQVPPAVTKGRNVEVSVTVRNTGDRSGVEVVQLYVSQRVASIAPPVKRLKRFARLFLPAGESAALRFTLTSDDLSFIGANSKPVLELGTFDVLIGSLKSTFEVK